VVHTVASQREGSWFRSWRVPPMSVLVLSRQSGFLPHSKNMYVRLSGDSKLTLGASVSMHGCLSHLSLY